MTKPTNKVKLVEHDGLLWELTTQQFLSDKPDNSKAVHVFVRDMDNPQSQLNLGSTYLSTDPRLQVVS